jgi:hypothetical protein
MRAAVVALLASVLLAACTSSTATPPQPDGTGSPTINPAVSLTTVACEPLQWCIAAGSNPSASTDPVAIEVSKGGHHAWVPAAAPQLVGVTFSSSACWSSGCLVGGSGPSGTVLLLVNPQNRVSSQIAARPPGSGIAALDCVGPGHCVALVTATTSTAVFETTDSGTSWTALSALPPALSVGTALSCATPRWCVAVGAGPVGASVAFSVDGAHHWRLASRPAGLQVLTSVSCGRNLQCLATARVVAGTTELLESATGGRSWVVRPSLVETPTDVDCTIVPQCVVGGSANGAGALSSMLRMRHALSLSLAYVPDPILAVACASASRCAAVTQASTVGFVP